MLIPKPTEADRSRFQGAAWVEVALTAARALPAEQPRKQPAKRAVR